MSKTGVRISTSMIIIQLAISLLIFQSTLGLTTPSYSPFGEQQVAVVLASFPNYSPEHNVSEINDWVFQNVSQMIYEISYGRTWLTGKVIGWVRLSKNIEEYYEQQIVKEAVRLSDPFVDFSKFNRLLVIHSGPSYQLTGNSSYPETSWSNLVVPTMDLRTFVDYMLVSERASVYSILHELCHSLGAVDLYNVPKSFDLNPETNDSYIGTWCLMGEGLTQMCLFNKLKVGFIRDSEVFHLGSGSATLELIGISESKMGFRGVRFNRHNDSKYYLIEARTAVGLDRYVREGVVVTVVDESREPGYGIVDFVSSCENGSIKRGAFRVGDSFYDRENGFVMHVNSRTKHGFNITVGTSPHYVAEQSVFLPARNNELINDIDLSSCINGLMFCVVSRNQFYPTYYNYVEVYKSANSGKSWQFLYNTTFTKMNCSDPQIAMVNETPVLIVNEWNQTLTRLAIINGVTNRTIHHILLEPELALRGFSCTSDLLNDLVYVCWSEQNLRTGIFTIHYGIWNGSEWSDYGSELQNAMRPELSNVPHWASQGISRPLLIYRDPTRIGHVRLTSFGNNEPIVSWANATVGGIPFDYNLIVSPYKIQVIITEYLITSNGSPYLTRLVEGNDINDLDEIYSFYGLRSSKPFVFSSSSNPQVGLLAYNDTKCEWTLLNWTRSLQIITEIPTTSNLQIAPSYSADLDTVVAVSEWMSSTSNSYIWRVAISSRSPYYHPFFFELPDYQWLLLAPLAIIILAIIVPFISLVAIIANPSWTDEIVRLIRRAIASVANQLPSSKFIILISFLNIVIITNLLWLFVCIFDIGLASYSTYQMARMVLPSILRSVLFIALPLMLILYLLLKIENHYL